MTSKSMHFNIIKRSFQRAKVATNLLHDAEPKWEGWCLCDVAGFVLQAPVLVCVAEFVKARHTVMTNVLDYVGTGVW